MTGYEMRKKAVRRRGEVIAAFWHDTSGIMLPYVTTALVAIVGFSMLAIDGSRFMSLQTQMQAARDSWIIDGYGDTATVWERCGVADTWVHVDLPLPLIQGLFAGLEGWPKDSPLWSSSYPD
jgi:hypothetical protein